MKYETDFNKYSKGLLIKLLRDMMLVRKFEEVSGQMYGLRKIGGFCHLYIGQEAVATGSIAALDLKKDYVLTGYRDHAHAILCGMEPKVAMAELYGKITGCSRGKGGSMHMFDKKNHMLGGNGIVAAHIPLAAGVAYKIRYLSENGVVLCFFGDGAIHQGAFHESLNLAKIWHLPVIYICENNQFGMGTSFRRVSSVENFSIMGDSYGITGKQVNGMDVINVYEEVSMAVKDARENKRPHFLEIKTYRYKGHSMSDPAKYRTKEEVEEYRKQDPIIILQENMKEKNMLSESEISGIEKEIKKICDDAVKFADESEEPAIKTMYEDVLI